MVIHHFTLLALCEEISDQVRNSEVAEIFTQKKSELLISFIPQRDGTSPTLCISVEPRSHYFYLRASLKRAKRNSRDLFSALPGSQLVSMSVTPFDRVVVLKFSNALTLLINLFNSVMSNILLVDDQGTIVEAFKDNKDLRGTPVPVSRPPFDERILRQKDSLISALTRDSTLTILSAMTRALPFLGGTYAKEVLHRSELKPEAFVSSCSQEDLDTVVSQVAVLLHELRHPDACIASVGGGETVFSLVELMSLRPSGVEHVRTVNEAIQRFVTRSYREKGEDDERNRIQRRIQEELRKAEHARSVIVAELEGEDRAAHHALAGRLLMSNLHLLSKGMKSIQLSDSTTPDVRHDIVLDASLSPVQNAERYFDKSKKARARRIESATRLKSTEETVRRLGELLTSLEGCSTHDDMKRFRREHERELRSMKVWTGQADEAALPFRMFTVAGGYEVWVGKSSASNDLLTMKYAKPNDLWFHVRGASGSHTVLKVPNGSNPPPREAIRQAAAIAVYYSKMRKAGNVPVAYCERKYVRKPRGAAPGTVYLEREEVVFVQPKLPSVSAS